MSPLSQSLPQNEQVIADLPQSTFVGPTPDVVNQTPWSEEEILTHTPMMQAFMRIKNSHLDKLVFYRMGDFYELFFNDAVVASKVLSIALTKRGKSDKDQSIPMCGVPFHALDNYVSKVVKKGLSAVIVEQMGEANKKTLITREVVKIITPGTVVDSNLLDEKDVRYLACVYKRAQSVDIAWVNFASGEIWCNTVATENFVQEIEKIAPSEVLISDKQKDHFNIPPSISLKLLPHWEWEEVIAKNNLSVQFGPQWQHLFSLPQDTIVCVISALLNYLKSTQKKSLTHIQNIKWIKSEDYIQISKITSSSLELLTSPSGLSLWSTLDHCSLSSGSRLLKNWLSYPIRNEQTIISRLDRVQWLKGSADSKPYLSWLDMMSSWCDLERVSTRLAMGIARPKELAGLRDSLRQVPKLTAWAQDMPLELRGFFTQLHSCEGALKVLERYLLEEPAVWLRDGDVISSAVSSELTEARQMISGHDKYLKTFEQEQKIKTNIPNLRVEYNMVHGFYIFVSQSHLPKVPPEYKVKQTMKNATRYTNPELQAYEGRALSAKDRALKLEKELWEEMMTRLGGYVNALQKLSKMISEWDVLASFAKCADIHSYCRPELNQPHLKLKDSRHPVVCTTVKDFSTNDILLDQDNQALIITGANMGGKSTLMRQCALACIMAHIGCFVPASFAQIPSIDAIYTRIGASDDLASGRSTFMVEMSECAYILNNATSNSLVIIDELGRGTSTYDGLSLAWAVSEYLCKNIGCKFLFATHYLELTELSQENAQIKNFYMQTIENDNDIIFTHKLTPGKSLRSYGVQVARLAGVKPQVISLANAKLSCLESISHTSSAPTPSLSAKDSENMAGESTDASSLLGEIKNLDLSNTTPMQALVYLDKLQRGLKK